MIDGSRPARSAPSTAMLTKPLDPQTKTCSGFCGRRATTSAIIALSIRRPKSEAQLRDDVQLSLYALAAREAWDVESPVQSYLYVLDDQKVPLPGGDVDAGRIGETVLEVADGIGSQG